MLKTKKQKPSCKALVLFSGGLDSRLVVKILQDQNIEPILVMFKLPFGGGCCNNEMCAFQFAQKHKAKLHLIDCTKGKLFQEYLEIIRDPLHKRGSAYNPCIDCRIFILKHAKKLLKKLNCQFLATGEVLGERPMSQHLQAMNTIEKQTKLENQILRPLSAKLLEPTEPENQGLVNRNKLLSIKGRNRKPQIALANKYKIQYPSPGGGCILCEKLYSEKLKDLLKHKPTKDIKSEELQILRGFRHFRSNKSNKKIILGRQESENNFLEKINKKIKWNTHLPETSGPTAIYEDKKDKILAQQIVQAYSSKTKSLRKKFDKLLVNKS